MSLRRPVILAEGAEVESTAAAIMMDLGMLDARVAPDYRGAQTRSITLGKSLIRFIDRQPPKPKTPRAAQVTPTRQLVLPDSQTSLASLGALTVGEGAPAGGAIEQLLARSAASDKANEDRFAKLENRILTLESDNERLRDELAQVKSENAGFREENTSLRQENASLREENTVLRQEIAALREENSLLRQEIAALREENTSLRQDIAALREENTSLRQEVDLLKSDMKQIRAELRKVIDLARPSAGLQARSDHSGDFDVIQAIRDLGCELSMLRQQLRTVLVGNLPIFFNSATTAFCALIPRHQRDTQGHQ